MSTMTAVKGRPILFSAPMVRAILSGAKTQTRRVVRDQPPAHMNSAVPYLKPDDGPQQWCFTGPRLDAAGKPLPTEQWEGGWPDCSPAFVCPHGVPGDRLWVRETCMPFVDGYGKNQALYRASGDVADAWKPSIFMPRWASRITLELTDVRVQRVQEISCADAIAEGIHPTANSMTIDCDTESPRDGFRSLWDSINAKRVKVKGVACSFMDIPSNHPYSWKSNPWVFALTFRRLP